MEIGLFFGSFNPVHTGHLIIANHMIEDAGLDEVWMVLSPQNPFKSKEDLAPDKHRLEMLRKAVRGNGRIKASKIEFSLPRPSYTIHTLDFLTKKYPVHRYVLIMGEDNLHALSKWKSIYRILDEFEIYVYKRPNSLPHTFAEHPAIKIFDFPTINISATYIRKRISSGRSVQYLVPTSVLNYLRKHNIYAQ